MPQAPGAPYSHEFANPRCLKCGAPMLLAGTEEEYPGYHRRIFECRTCGALMTEWAGNFRRGRADPVARKSICDDKRND